MQDFFASNVAIVLGIVYGLDGFFIVLQDLDLKSLIIEAYFKGQQVRH